jgi:hypothetical protein
MTNDEINIAIAEYCGWQILEPEVHPCIIYHWAIKPDGSKRISPDYCNDLNEMHEAEKTLSDKIYDEYWSELVYICVRLKEERINSTSAKVRAEAFLRAIGKWKE